MDEKTFSARILGCVNKALEVYGSTVSQVIFWQFRNTSKLAPIDVAEKPEEFVKCLKLIFGASREPIERMIAKEICAEFKLQLEIDRICPAVEAARAKT